MLCFKFIELNEDVSAVYLEIFPLSSHHYAWT